MKLRVKDLFRDLTWTQVGASALAAATALFLSSTIGIAGSVIGAAVGSVVTTLSSAIYKSVFAASGDAIKKKIVGEEDADAPDGQTHDGQAACATTVLESASETAVLPDGPHGAPTASWTSDTPGVQETPEHSESRQPTVPFQPADTPAVQETPGHPGGYQPTVPFRPATVGQSAAGVETVAPYAAPSPSHVPDELERVRTVAAERKARRRNRAVAALSFATGLVAVGICAAVIAGATGGNGIGYKPEPLIQRSDQPTVTDETAVEEPADAGETVTDSQSGQGSGDEQSDGAAPDSQPDPSPDGQPDAAAPGDDPAGSIGGDGASETTGQTDGGAASTEVPDSSVDQGDSLGDTTEDSAGDSASDTGGATDEAASDTSDTDGQTSSDQSDTASETSEPASA